MAKGKREIELTEEIDRAIVAYIRAGAFPHIAAEAAGVPRQEFERWLELGCPVDRPNRRKWKPHPKYTPFWHRVSAAKAQARLTAEIQALKDDPIAWLKSGPGKDRPNDPGWSTPVKQVTVTDNRQVNVLLSPEMQGIFASILQVLAPFPEARAAVAQALAHADKVDRTAQDVLDLQPMGEN